MNKKIKGYLMEKYSNMGTAYTCRRLVEEAGKRDMELSILGIHDICVGADGIYYCKKEAGSEKLAPADFVIHRYKWGRLVSEAGSLGARNYNPLMQYERYINKYEQVKNLHSEVFQIPDYLLAKASLDYGFLAEKLGVPFVAKGLESSQGTEVFLISKETDYLNLKEWFDSEKEFLFEKYIEESAGKDLRIYSIRGKAIACMTRSAVSGFRANVALGASVEKHEITEEIAEAAKDIYEETGLDFLGIDLLFGKDGYYLCEINVMPGIQGMEQATGVNVAGQIMETIRGDFEV